MKLTKENLTKLVEEIMNENPGKEPTLQFVPFQRTPDSTPEDGADVLVPHFSDSEYTQQKLREIVDNMMALLPSQGDERLYKDLLAVVVTDVIRHTDAIIGDKFAQEFMQSGENRYLKDKLR